MNLTLKYLQPKMFITALALAVAGLGASAAAQSRWGSITVYNDINFQGESTTFNGNMPNLVENGWNDRISSVRIPDGQAWEVCVDVNFGNRCQVLTSSVSDLRSMGLN